MPISVAITGVSGYVGAELVRLLSQHPQVKIQSLVSGQQAGRPYEDIYPQFKDLDLPHCRKENMEKLADECDVIFLAIPHGNAMGKISPHLLKKTRIIDMSADFRLEDPAIYKKWYGLKHETPELLKESVYGLPELNRQKIKKARLIANPGCYTTASILSLYPLIKSKLIRTDSIIIDAKSGTSGAGRELKQPMHYSELNENLKAYSVGQHRHTPEIEQLLSEIAGEKILLSFTPHLIPMSRGILITAYASLKESLLSSPEEVQIDQIEKAYKACYDNEFFIRFKGKEMPETRYVKTSNFLDMGFSLDQRTGRVIVSGALDNMIKGAAGQALQNMNLLFGLEETTGLQNLLPPIPG